MFLERPLGLVKAKLDEHRAGSAPIGRAISLTLNLPKHHSYLLLCVRYAEEWIRLEACDIFRARRVLTTQWRASQPSKRQSLLSPGSCTKHQLLSDRKK